MMMDGLCEHLKYNYLTMKIVNQFLFLIISQFFLIQLANCDGDSIFKNTYFVILSQPNKADLAMAHQTRKLLENDLENQEGITIHSNKKVLLVSEDISYHGSWTIFPVISELINSLKLTKAKWFVFLDAKSRVNLKILREVLETHKNDHFLGQSLEDPDHTVIHHYADPKELQYPNFEAGFVLSASLVEELALSLAEFGHELDWIPSDFSIDPQYEFAKALKMRNKDLNLRHDSRFCCASNGINNGGTKECAIFRENGDRNNQTSDEDLMILLLAKNTLFAVKTCEKFHQERLPVIKDTWGQAALQIMYFSEITDPEIGTIQLDGVTNTERGHCHKTMEIIKYFNKEASKNDWKWLVIADDDTILSVNQMLKFLHSFDPNVPVHAGQRYGYGIATGKYGYDYVTGGGGMIFSIEMTRRIVKNLGLCSCPSKDTPDDMHLGMCMSHLGLEIVHSSRFHQARPEDYSQKLLHCQDPISFHKFWNSNPHQVYKKWFESHDQMLKQYKYNQNHRHQEL